MQKSKGIEPKPALSEAEVMAVRACASGTANPDQAKIAMEWVMREASRVTDLSYRPESPLETAFNEGRRYVGILIRYMMLPETLANAKAADKSREAKR